MGILQNAAPKHTEKMFNTVIRKIGDVPRHSPLEIVKAVGKKKYRREHAVPEFTNE